MTQSDDESRDAQARLDQQRGAKHIVTSLLEGESKAFSMYIQQSLTNYPAAGLAKTFTNLAGNDVNNYTEGYTEANEKTRKQILKRAGISDPERFVVLHKTTTVPGAKDETMTTTNYVVVEKPYKGVMGQVLASAILRDDTRTQDGKPVGSMSTEMTIRKTGTKVSVVERDGQGTTVYHGTIDAHESGLTYRAEHEKGIAGGGISKEDLQDHGKRLRESRQRKKEESRSSSRQQEDHSQDPAMQRALSQFTQEQGSPATSLPYKTTDRANEQKL